MVEQPDYTVIKQARRECPWCDKAIQTLQDAGHAPTIRELGRPKLAEESGKALMNTIPIIYMGDTLIGGYEELVAHLEKDLIQ